MIAQPPRQRRPISGQRLLNVAILLFVVLGLTMVPRLREATGQTTTPIYKDPAAPIPNRVADLLSRMTLDEKIGQMTQPDRGSLTAESDIATYYLGSILSGGGSAPSPNTPTAWADMYDRYQRIALSTRLGIPMIYGIDAVHGHNNVNGATIFPHNIGLGATRNPALIQQVGRATAEEVAGTGIDWTFAPCLCVARNERWGRTYESYGEDPEIARAMTTIVTGLQGSSLNQPGSILATAKHWVGDGGTVGGDDQGNTQISEAELRRLHIPPYVDAIQKGVGSVMISYSSWNGQKLHGHKYLITDVLKGELGFGGFVVSDWAGIDQLPGDYPSDVRTSINAGIDMVMVPHNYQLFTSTLRSEVNAGTVPLSRIDDAVRRILTKKFELGLFERPLTDRSYTATIGSAAHRAIARDAVRQSLVLLKNTNNILPLSKSARIFVAGKNADDIGNQSGGWTISWQGGSGNTTPGTTILQGIRNTVAPGTTVTYNKGGRGAAGHDVAVVVIGEKPYAEGQGDAPSYLGLDQDDKNTLNTVKRSGVPMVVVLVSGRPQIISSEIGGWQGLIAAWLPGTEGQGVADVLFGDYRPTGKLPHSWPRSEAQIPINIGDATYDPLFPYGFGLTYPSLQTYVPLRSAE
ncbi:MAG TPA: glycoside hydrolase family 3 N-terminal domain-containing protein [Herpetosiphonaceae bacterium]